MTGRGISGALCYASHRPSRLFRGARRACPRRLFCQLADDAQIVFLVSARHFELGRSDLQLLHVPWIFRVKVLCGGERQKSGNRARRSSVFAFDAACGDEGVDAPGVALHGGQQQACGADYEDRIVDG